MQERIEAVIEQVRRGHTAEAACARLEVSEAEFERALFEPEVRAEFERALAVCAFEDEAALIKLARGTGATAAKAQEELLQRRRKSRLAKIGENDRTNPLDRLVSDPSLLARLTDDERTTILAAAEARTKAEQVAAAAVARLLT